jgi:superfamily I DNA/RNA helicase
MIHRVKPFIFSQKVKNKSVRGDMLQLHICEDRKKALKKLSVLIDRYRNNGYPYEQICIITTKTEALSLFNGVEKVGNHTIASNRGKNNVLFTTARKFKGLESDTIILVDVDVDTFKDEENKRLFYVGASRAKHSLDIVFVGDDAALAELDDVLSDDKAPNPIIGVARSLNVKPMKALE